MSHVYNNILTINTHYMLADTGMKAAKHIQCVWTTLSTYLLLHHSDLCWSALSRVVVFVTAQSGASAAGTLKRYEKVRMSLLLSLALASFVAVWLCTNAATFSPCIRSLAMGRGYDALGYNGFFKGYDRCLAHPLVHCRMFHKNPAGHWTGQWGWK